MAYEQLIESYYEAILRETPTDAQIELWESVLSDADDLEEAIADFAQALCLQAEEVRSILRLYQAVFDRVSDSGGLTYWTNIFREVQEDNPDLSYKEALIETITQWLESDEYVERFGSDLSDEDFLSLLYINILGRPADQDGYDFWLAILESGDMTREELIIEFTESDELKDQMDEEANNLLKTAAALASDETADDPDYEIPGDDVYQGELGNEAPTDILVGTDVDEDAENGDLVNEGQLTAVDPDGGETFTWELIDPSGAFGLDDPNAQQPNIIVVDASKLDHETADVMTVTIRVTDSAGNTYEEEVQIDVNDVNEAPTDILPEGPIAIDDPEAVDEAGDVITTLTAVDEDEGDNHTFTILNQTVAGAFAIVGDEVQVADPSLLGTGIHEITIEVEDSGGETTERTITIDLSELNEIGENFAFTLDQDALGGTDRNDTYRASSGYGEDEDRGDGFGRTANTGDYANGGDGYDRFILTRPDDENDHDRSVVSGVELENIEVLELTNDDDSHSDPEDAEEIEWGECDPFINLPQLGPDDASELLFYADKSPNIDRVEITDSLANVTVYDLQEEFWTKTPDDETDDGPTVLIADTTADVIWIDSDIQSKEFVDEDGDGKDDGELVIILDEATVNEVRITENASDKVPGDNGDDGDRGEQVGTITLRVTGDAPSALGAINNGDGDEDPTGSSTHTLNIEVEDLTDSRPSTGKPSDVANLAALNSAAIDFFLGIDSGYELGDGLLGLENINITGDGDVYLSFDEDIDNDDDDGDGFTIEIQDSGGNSFFHFEEDSFGNDVKLDGGDGFDTLIVYESDLWDHPGALDNVTNIERIIVLDSLGKSDAETWEYDDVGMRDYIQLGDQCLFGDDGDNQLVGGTGNDFLDAGSGGTDVLVGDHHPHWIVTRVAFDSDDDSVSDGDVFEIEVDWDGDGVADYTASYTADSSDDIDDVVEELEALLEANQPLWSDAHIGDSNSNNSLYIHQPGEEGSTINVLSATKTNSSGVSEDLSVTKNWESGSDIFVAGARDIEDFSDGFDNDNLPDDVDGLMEAAGRTPGSDGPDEGADGVVYVLDFNQGNHGNNAWTPINEAYNANEGDLLAFRDSDGNLDDCGSATNYQEVQDQGVSRDDADANAFNAFASNDGLRYYVNARSFEDALLDNTGLVWGVDVNQNIVDEALEDLADGIDDGIGGPGPRYSGSSQDLIDMITEAKADSWLRVYYNEEGTDATPEAVFELVGLDNISQFSFEDIGGADCIEDKTDPFEYLFC